MTTHPVKTFPTHINKISNWSKLNDTRFRVRIKSSRKLYVTCTRAQTSRELSFPKLQSTTREIKSDFRAFLADALTRGRLLCTMPHQLSRRRVGLYTSSACLSLLLFLAVRAATYCGSRNYSRLGPVIYSATLRLKMRIVLTLGALHERKVEIGQWSREALGFGEENCLSR